MTVGFAIRNYERPLSLLRPTYVVTDVLLLGPGDEGALPPLHGELAGVGGHSLAVTVRVYLVASSLPTGAVAGPAIWKVIIID